MKPTSKGGARANICGTNHDSFRSKLFTVLISTEDDRESGLFAAVGLATLREKLGPIMRLPLPFCEFFS